MKEISQKEFQRLSNEEQEQAVPIVNQQGHLKYLVPESVEVPTIEEAKQIVNFPKQLYHRIDEQLPDTEEELKQELAGRIVVRTRKAFWYISKQKCLEGEAGDFKLPTGLRAIAYRIPSYGVYVLLIDQAGQRFLFGYERDAEKSLLMAVEEIVFPRSVQQAIAKGLKVVRQGDVYFIPAKIGRRKKEPVRGMSKRLVERYLGNHKATQGYVEFEPEFVYDGTAMFSSQGIYVKGMVKHPEHPAIRLRTWHRAVVAKGD